MKRRNRHTFCNIVNTMTRKAFAIISILFFLSACTKEDRNNTIVNQEERIDRYITSLSNVRVARNGGSNRIVYTEGQGEEAAAGDLIKFYYAGYIFNGGKGTLFATNNPEVAQANSFPVSSGAVECVLGSGSLVRGLDAGLVGVKAGEKCDVVFSAKYGYNNTVVYNVPKMTPLIFEVWVEDIVKN